MPQFDVWLDDYETAMFALLLLVLRPFSVLMECSGGSGMDTCFALSSRAVITSDAGTLLLLSILPMQL